MKYKYLTSVVVAAFLFLALAALATADTAQCPGSSSCTTCCQTETEWTAADQDNSATLGIIVTILNNRRTALDAAMTSSGTDGATKNIILGILDGRKTVLANQKSTLDARVASYNTCTGTCTVVAASTCGNGIKEGSEVCDDGNTVTETQCTTYVGSGSFCNAGCSAAITLTCPKCGDGAVNGPEACDEGTALNGQPNHCNAQCSGTTAAVCGNSVKEGTEVCDDGNSNGQPNKCNAQCTGTTAAVCGNTVVEAGEQCDSNLGQACTAPYGGTCNYCSNSCQTVTVTGPSCGDGIVNGNEVCDGGTQSCTVNSYSGAQSCNAQCTGYSACVSSQNCGDGIINGNEQCDGTALGTATCPAQGFSAGTLSCTSQCLLNTDQCTYTLTVTRTEPAIENAPAGVLSPATGTVTSSPAGINCGSSCVGTYAKDALVTLTATPLAPGVFSGWAGAQCTESTPGATCTVKMDAVKSVTATFRCEQGKYRGIDASGNTCDLSAGCPRAQQCVVENNIFKWKEVSTI